MKCWKPDIDLSVCVSDITEQLRNLIDVMRESIDPYCDIDDISSIQEVLTRIKQRAEQLPSDDAQTALLEDFHWLSGLNEELDRVSDSEVLHFVKIIRASVSEWIDLKGET